MRFLLYGSGKLAKRVYEYVKSAEGIEISFVCADEISDGNNRIVLSAGNELDSDIPACSMENAAGLLQGGDVDAVILACANEFVSYVTRRLLEQGIYDLCMLPSYYENEEYEIDDGSFIWIDVTKPRLDYVEYQISFHCNLNCKGCSHFSNLVREPRFGSLENFRKDMLRLTELFWGIGKIRLMGGEPVLNPELPDFVYASREAFPDADIRVVSNGLMIRKENTRLFEAMRECAVYFDISMYPPTKGAINRISQICREEKVTLTVTPEITEFGAGMNLHGKEDPARSFQNCPARHCVYLQDGKFSACAMPQLASYYNDAFGCSVTAGNKDVTDIYQPGLKGIDIIERMKTPMEICRFCDPARRNFTWKPSINPVAEEWIGRPLEK